MNVEIKDDKQNPFNLANRMYYVFKRLHDEDNPLVSFTYLFQETCRYYMLGLIEYADKKKIDLLTEKLIYCHYLI